MLSIPLQNIDNEYDAELISRLFGSSPLLSELSGPYIPEDILRTICWVGGDKLTSLIIYDEDADDPYGGITFNNADYTIELLCRGCPNLNRLRIDEYIEEANLTDISTCHIVKYLPHIQHLTINWYNLTDTSMYTLSNLTTLISITLTTGFVDIDSITSTGIRSLLEANNHLETINLCSSHIDNNILLCIQQKGCILKDLSLTHSGTQDSNITNTNIINILQYCILLESVHIKGWCMTNEFLLILSQYCTHICHIVVDWSLTDTVSDVENEAGNIITSTYTNNITDIALTTMLKACTEIRTLNPFPSSTTDISLHTISIYCTKLEIFYVKNNYYITDNGMCDMFTVCTNLIHIHIQNCINITDKSIFTLVYDSPKVRILTLTGCPRLTETSLLYVATYTRRLEQLKISKLVVSDEVISIIAKRCIYLKYVSIHHCTSLSSVGILSVIKKCRRLKCIHVWSCGIHISPELRVYIDIDAVDSDRGLTVWVSD